MIFMYIPEVGTNVSQGAAFLNVNIYIRRGSFKCSHLTIT